MCVGVGVLCMCAHGGVCSEWGGDDNMHAYQTTVPCPCSPFSFTIVYIMPIYNSQRCSNVQFTPLNHYVICMYVCIIYMLYDVHVLCVCVC